MNLPIPIPAGAGIGTVVVAVAGSIIVTGFTVIGTVLVARYRRDRHIRVAEIQRGVVRDVGGQVLLLPDQPKAGGSGDSQRIDAPRPPTIWLLPPPKRRDD